MKLDGTAVVLAGGESRRFGGDKRLAAWGNGRLIETAVHNAATVFTEVIVTAKRPTELSFLERPGVRVAADLYDAHALGGLLTGLALARSPHVFALAGDMPLVRPSVARALWARRRRADAVVPRWNGRLQPLCAVYARQCRAAGEAMAAENIFALRDLLDRVDLRVVEEDVLRLEDPKGLSFLDADTPEELAALRRFSVGKKAA
jgi:molybdopterin-guanine dinucleotide biosynthesis protein A